MDEGDWSSERLSDLSSETQAGLEYMLAFFCVILLSLNPWQVGEGVHPGSHHPIFSWSSRSDHCSSPGLPRRLRSTSLLWRGSTQEALSLLKDDVLVADPGTR